MVIEEVLAILNKNVVTAQRIVRETARRLSPEQVCDCETALADAIITDRAMIPETVQHELEPIIGKYING